MRRIPVRRFLSELSRRHVFRVLIGYVIAAWVLIQVAETTFPYLGLPEWSVTVVIVAGIAGIPVAALLSWVFDLTPEGIRTTSSEPTAAAAPPPAPERPPRLPVPVGPLIGRETELAEAETLLAREDVRLLTVTGAAGTGKTRLALELAHRAAGSFPDGAHWVTLGGITDPALVPSAIGQALGVGEAGSQGLTDRLADALEGREPLVVLDNFEHLLPAAPAVADLLAACRDLTLLVTSRAPLRVRGEREFSLGPLGAPDPGAAGARLREAPAVRLFTARAREVEPAFELTDENLTAVATICARLDGLPLAIELAAVRVKLLTPEAMLARLDRRLPLLTGGPRDLPSRHRTLREAIAWSHDLLDDAERRLLRRLSVFAGGCDVEAAETVCSEADGPATLDLLQSLVDQSLLRKMERPGVGTRLSMLETIREYAAERLSGSDEEEAIRARHLAYFTALAEKAEPQLAGASQAEWLERLETEHDNFRAALAWTAETDRVEDALRLTLGLWRLWEMRGHLREGRQWLDGLLARDRAVPGKLRRKALYAAGILADAQGDYAAAERRFQETLDLHRAEGDRWGVANALNNVGVMALRRGDYAAADALYRESVGLWRELGNEAAIALALNNLGNVARLRGAHAEARDLLEESLTMHRARGDRNGCALTLGLLGDIARDEGNADLAERLYEESLELFRTAGNAPQLARTLLELARMALASDLGAARARSGASLRLSVELGNPRGVAEAMETLAGVAEALDEAERAEELRGAASEIREAAGARSLAHSEPVRAALAWAEGPAEKGRIGRDAAALDA